MRRSFSSGGGKPLIEHVTPADGNIFADLGAAPAEAQNLLVRAQLMLQIKRLIKARNFTQMKAARLLGVTQPRINDLLRGRIERFSIDALVMMLARAGLNVELTVEPRAA